jgi:transposase-like protein
VLGLNLVIQGPYFPQEHATMAEVSSSTIGFRVSASRDVLSEVLRAGAQQMLATAIEAEVSEWIAEREHLKNEQGHRQVIRNGHLPKRQIITGVGPLEVEQPRVRDRRRITEREPFHSQILPPYLRKTKSIEELLPWLYLKGISTGDFQEALQSLLGPECPGLSAATITALLQQWQAEYQAWSKRSLSGKKYVYVWADGVYFNIRLEEDRPCILVLLGATEDGQKELLAIVDGYRESEQSWTELMLDVKSRGLTVDPKLATGDGALGFWKALPKVFPKTGAQRCWFHKSGNVIDQLPKRLQAGAKEKLHQIWMAETRQHAHEAFDLFVETYQAKYPKAAECLEKDREELLAFYDFPAEHWVHLRTTNPIESVFATVKHRQKKTRGNGSRAACLAMVFKLTESASRKWRTLNGSSLLPDVIQGVQFIDGIKHTEAAA